MTDITACHDLARSDITAARAPMRSRAAGPASAFPCRPIAAR